MNESAGAQQRMANRNRRTAWVGGGALLAIAGIGLWLGAATVASGEGEADVVIDPASKSVALGSGEFNVDVKVESVSNLGSYDLLIKFNNDVLEYVGMAKTSYLTSTGRSQTCPSAIGGPAGESPTEFANDVGALRFGCTTTGLIVDGSGTAGPSGSGVLATLTFKPRNPGAGDIEFGGILAPEMIVPPSDEYQGFGGSTGLSEVDRCTAGGDCVDASISVGARGAAITVFDPAAPTPTGVPATPTRVAPGSTPDTRATATSIAISKTPVGQRTPPSGTTGGTTGGSTGGTTGGGASGGVAGQGAGGSGSGTTGPDGAPIAGYGPQQDSDPWPLRAGMLMTLAGGLIMAGGALSRRPARD